MFMYDNREDPNAIKVQEYVKANGIEAAIDRFCELDTSVDNDRIWHQLVYGHYRDLQESKETP